MTAIETEGRVTVTVNRLQPRLLLAQRMKPQRGRAVIRALLRVLGVAFAEAEIVTPVEAPIDVRFRQAQFHLRELGGHPQGCAGQAHDTRMHHASMRADRGALHHPAVGMDLTVGISQVTAALAEHAAWYGAWCVGLDVVVAVDGYYGVLARPHTLQRSVRWPCKAGARCRWCVRPLGWCCMPRAVRLTFCAR